MNENRGIALPGVMMLAALLAVALLTFWGDAAVQIKRLGVSLQAESVFEQERALLLTKGIRSSNQRVACDALTIPAEIQRCLLNRSTLDLINYREIFDDAELCSSHTIVSAKTGFGNLLTKGSARSNRICNRIGSKIYGNLEAEKVHLRENSSTEIIAASGYIDLLLLEVSSDATIIAGGDLFIKRLEATKLASLTILSSTGRVEIGEVLGPVTLNVFTKKLSGDLGATKVPLLSAFTLALLVS